MKLELILTKMAPSILTLNVDGLCGSAKRADEINVTDINSSRKDQGATGAIGHAASDAIQPSCDSTIGNNTASSDMISVTGAGEDPANISSVNKSIDNILNDSTDNEVSVITVDFGLMPSSNVSRVTNGSKGIVGNVGCGVGAGHVVSGDVVVAS